MSRNIFVIEMFKYWWFNLHFCHLYILSEQSLSICIKVLQRFFLQMFNITKPILVLQINHKYVS